MPDVFLKAGEANLSDIKLVDPTLPGIGLAVKPGIGLATPVDFVHDGGWVPAIAQLRRLPPGVEKVVNIEPWRRAKQESAELKEMIELYALWKRAA